VHFGPFGKEKSQKHQRKINKNKGFAVSIDIPHEESGKTDGEKQKQSIQQYDEKFTSVRAPYKKPYGRKLKGFLKTLGLPLVIIGILGYGIYTFFYK